MTVSHKALPNAQLHECKGASAASSGQVSIATGAGVSTYRYLTARGAVSFVNIASPNVITYPSAFTKIAPTTVASGAATEITEATTSKLTYTGAGTINARITANLSLDQAVGANRDIELAIYKNGSIVTGSNIVSTCTSALKQLLTSIIDVSLTTNDYVECYVKNRGVSGDVNIYSFYLALTGTKV